jgi:hypothetical protein
MKQGYPLYSPYGCRLGYHQSEAWQVEQKVLPPQFYEAIMVISVLPNDTSVRIWTRTHTLLSLNLVLLTTHKTL